MAKSKAPERLTPYPLAVAYCCIARRFRTYLRKRQIGLQAVLIIEDASAIEFFKSAAEKHFLGRETFSIRRVYDEAAIHVLTRKKTDVATLIAILGDTPRSILIASVAEDVPPEFLAAADVVQSFGPPDVSIIKAAIFQMSGLSILDADASDIQSRSWQQVAAAFRVGRPVGRALQALRRMPPHGRSTQRCSTMEDFEPGVEDLIGYGEAQSWGLQVVQDTRDLKAGRIAGRDVDGGILISGPPGCGKTSFAKALAKSCDVPYFFASASKWQSAGHMGDMLREMHSTFAEVRSQAPCVLLIDEIDSFGDRINADHANRGYVRQVINALLELLDGSMDRQGVIVVGTANHPEFLDPAFTRAGRLEKHAVISLPEAEARLQILERYLGFHLTDVERERIAGETEGWSGADLERLARQSRRNARQQGRDLEGVDVLASLPELFEMPLYKLRTTALHEAGHIIVGLAFGRQIQGVRLLERYRPSNEELRLGGVYFANDEKGRRTVERYRDEIAMFLSGMAAEQEFLGSHDDGVGGSLMSDLVQATNLATSMIANFGMGSSLISEVLKGPGELENLRRRNPGLCHAVDTVMHEQMKRARQIIAENRSSVSALAEKLVQVKSMRGDELIRFVEAIVSRPESPPSDTAFA